MHVSAGVSVGWASANILNWVQNSSSIMGRQLLPWIWHCFFSSFLFSVCLFVRLFVWFFVLGHFNRKASMRNCCPLTFCRILEITHVCFFILSFFLSSIDLLNQSSFSIWSGFDMCVKCVLRTHLIEQKLKIAPSPNLIYLIDCNNSLIHQTGIRHIFPGRVCVFCSRKWE